MLEMECSDILRQNGDGNLEQQEKRRTLMQENFKLQMHFASDQSEGKRKRFSTLLDATISVNSGVAHD